MVSGCPPTGGHERLDSKQAFEAGATNEKMKPLTARWLKYLVAILVGNGLYFALNPYLPEPARHHPFKFDLGTLVDFWLCLVVYGLMELVAFLRKRGSP